MTIVIRTRGTNVDPADVEYYSYRAMYQGYERQPGKSKCYGYTYQWHDGRPNRVKVLAEDDRAAPVVGQRLCGQRVREHRRLDRLLGCQTGNRLPLSDQDLLTSGP